jgi:hypothetical protein
MYIFKEQSILAFKQKSIEETIVLVAWCSGTSGTEDLSSNPARVQGFLGKT